MSEPGITFYRISWTPGKDQLLASCHCGAWRELIGPIEAWDWLRDHSQEHEPETDLDEPVLACSEATFRGT